MFFGVIQDILLISALSVLSQVGAGNAVLPVEFADLLVAAALAGGQTLPACMQASSGQSLLPGEAQW